MNEIINVSMHPDWIIPHSLEWYKQLGELEGKYIYPWESIITEPHGETRFDSEVFQMISGKKVLDVGCGHGDFSVKCGEMANEVVGFDVTDQFIDTSNLKKRKNVTFTVGNVKDGLPFEKKEFDCAFIRKGPTSAYPLLREVVRDGGQILGIHPGDDSGIELPKMFPNLFTNNNINVMHKLENRLANSGFTSVEIETINSKEFLKSPLDVIKMCCFGQTERIMRWLMKEYLNEIRTIFNRNKTIEGLPITNSRYIVRITV